MRLPVKPNKNEQLGYTLLEVLVAFTILATALPILFRIFSTGVSNINSASEYSHAVLIAESKIDALGRAVDLHPELTQGIESETFRWTRTISNTELPIGDITAAPTIAAYRVHVAVEWMAGRNLRRLELATIRLDDLLNNEDQR